MDLNKFAEPLTTEAKYWIGFLLADGNISQISNNGRATLNLGLSSKDEEHVRKFAKFLGIPNSSVKNRDNSRGYSDSGRLTYTSTSIKDSVSQLLKYGIAPNKSLNAVPHESLFVNPDFWRGMVDGDGTVAMTSVPWIALCGSVGTVSAFAEYAALISGRRPAICQCKSIVKTTLNGTRAQRVISAVYYDDCSVYLDRKMEIAQRCKSWKKKYLSGSCNKGHLLTPENIYMYPNGRKQCKLCRKSYKEALFRSA
jgi:hypothetical protein